MSGIGGGGVGGGAVGGGAVGGAAVADGVTGRVRARGVGRVGLRGQGASILVAALSSAFGTLLLLVTGALTTYIESTALGQGSMTVQLALTALASVFFGIAVYVGAVVTANTVGTVIAGRTREIALLRLVGASGASLRRSVLRDGAVVGLVGAVIGSLAGIAITAATISVAVANGTMPDLVYTYISPELVAPVVVVALTTAAASWVGSRTVLDVSPIEATGSAHEARFDDVVRRPARYIVAALLVAAGAALLAIGVMVGTADISGVLVAMLGGFVSFTGVILGSPLVVPPVLRATGLLFGRGPVSALASANAVRNPLRSTRAMIGLVIGVTLVTMFAVAAESFQVMIAAAQADQPEVYEGTGQVLQVTVAIFSVLFGFSALLAAVGLVNNLSLSVLQRRRELGLLRALGFTSSQVRRMIVAEAAQMTVAAVVLGVVLGTFYGWCGAQALLGSIPGGGLIAPAVPLPLIAAVVVAAAVLTVVASLAPSRRATAISPVEALAV